MMRLKKYIVLIYIIACASLRASAQVIVFPYEPTNEEETNPRDITPLEFFSDIGLKNTRTGEVIDGVFIGPLRIGIDERKIKRDWAADAPFLLRGIGPNNDSLLIKSYEELGDTVVGGHAFPYFHLVHFRSTEPIELVTFDELRKEYFPNVRGPVVYTINKYIVADPTFFKLDKDFVYRLERFDSQDIEALKGFPPFTFIRVFTKVRHNWYWRQSNYDPNEAKEE